MVGLSAGLVIAFLGLTAAGFVLRPHLDGLVYGRLLRVPACYHRLPLDTLVANAVAAYSAGGAVTSIEIRSAATASMAIQFSDEEKVYLDPCTGAVLGRQNEYGGFFGFLDGPSHAHAATDPQTDRGRRHLLVRADRSIAGPGLARRLARHARGVAEGALVEVGLPRNHFPLEHSARHHLLIAGGIGVTPILCMAERLGAMEADFRMH